MEGGGGGGGSWWLVGRGGLNGVLNLVKWILNLIIKNSIEIVTLTLCIYACGRISLEPNTHHENMPI